MKIANFQMFQAALQMPLSRGLTNVYAEGELIPGVILVDGYYVTPKGQALGFEYKGAIFISPAAQHKGAEQTILTIGHELVHVIHYNAGLEMSNTDSFNGEAQTEHAAYAYEELHAQVMGWSYLEAVAYTARTSPEYSPPVLDTRYDNYVLPYHMRNQLY
jgi:hypothetical protein